MLSVAFSQRGTGRMNFPGLTRQKSDAFDEFLRQQKDVESFESLISPVALRHEIPISSTAQELVTRARKTCSDIVGGKDDRLIVVVGPCSIHDPQQALDYARHLKAAAVSFPDLLIMMRAYFEKPRTTVGWKGLINDPDLDGSCNINKGIFVARELLRDLTKVGLPLAVELLDTISPAYLSDFVSWGAIGARTTESQLHREIASGTSHPVGFKNGTDGGVAVAIEAMKTASAPHSFIGVNEEGTASIVKTKGNQYGHVILRGGKKGPNFSKASVMETSRLLLTHRPSHHPSIMIDCSHGNSEKDHRNQPKVVDNICAQLIEGNSAVNGVMIESNVHEGRQDIPPEGPSALKYGISITDACVDFQSTTELLKKLQAAVLERRKMKASLLAEEILLKTVVPVKLFEFTMNVQNTALQTTQAILDRH